MKRRFCIAGTFFLLTSLAAAQVHGVPASVTSPRDGDIFQPMGIPASVTSLGPAGFTTHERFVPFHGTNRNRLGRVINVAPIPLFYAVPYYPVMYVPMEESGVTQRVVERPRTPDEPQRVIVEIRDTRPAPEKQTATEARVESKSVPRVELPEPERLATTFIFRDGTRKELRDFAITETELIDLTAGLVKRSPLRDIDRAATLKANAEKGLEVHLPAGASD